MQGVKVSQSFSFIEKNSFFILIVGLMMGGVLIGSIAFCGLSNDPVNKLSGISQSFIETRAQQTPTDVFFDSLLSSTGQLFALFLLGFWALAQPIEIILPLLKGLGLGATLAEVYASAGIKGFFIILFLILPFTLLSLFALVIGTREAFRLSNIFAKKAFYDTNTTGMVGITRLYFQKFIILEIIIIVASVVDALCSVLFSRFIQ